MSLNWIESSQVWVDLGEYSRIDPSLLSSPLCHVATKNIQHSSMSREERGGLWGWLVCPSSRHFYSCGTEKLKKIEKRWTIFHWTLEVNTPKILYGKMSCSWESMICTCFTFLLRFFCFFMVEEMLHKWQHLFVIDWMMFPLFPIKFGTLWSMESEQYFLLLQFFLKQQMRWLKNVLTFFH